MEIKNLQNESRHKAKSALFQSAPEIWKPHTSAYSESSHQWRYAQKSTSTSQSSSEKLGESRPPRGADLNKDLVDRAEQADENLLLPSLNDSITLVDVEKSRGVPILQSLVLDHLLLHWSL